MGDNSTHVILFQAYWHLVYQNDEKMWVDTDTYDVVCAVGEEDKTINLSEVP